MSHLRRWRGICSRYRLNTSAGPTMMWVALRRILDTLCVGLRLDSANLFGGLVNTMYCIGRNVFVLVTGLSFGFCNAGVAQSVRVEVVNGAPRIVVNGRPVRARMFWGGPGAAPIRIGPKPHRVSFEFVPPEDEPQRATMHFRFGRQPGDIFIDNVRVVDLDAGRDVVPLCDFESGPDAFARDWTYWPRGEKNTVGTVAVAPKGGQGDSAALHVKLRAPKRGPWPDWHIYHHQNLSLAKGHRHRATFWIRANTERRLTCAFYRPGRVFTYLGGPPGHFTHEIKLAASAGVNFVSFPVRMPWPRPGESANWTTTDAQCKQVLSANSKALLLPRIGMEPPTWWKAKYRDDVMVWENGPRGRGFVVASPQYRRDAAERLAALVAHLEARFGERMAGYHPSGQNTGEWFYQDTWKREFSGYSQGTLRAWRRWLKKRYGNDAALQKAWADASATLESAAVPTPQARRAAPHGVFRDPATERAIIDFAAFQQQTMAECVCALARAVRKASKGRKLVVFFYGYVFEFGAAPNGPAVSGHYALRRVLNCPDIDILCSPISYFDRGLGSSAPAMTAAESVALADKMWLYEDDTRTHLGRSKAPGWRSGAKTQWESIEILKRNLAECALRNFGTWWMDLARTGWFDDPTMWDAMRQFSAVDEPLRRNPTPFGPEIAAVIDEASMMLVATGGNVVTRPLVYEARRPLGRLGAPYGQYLLDDVLAGRVKAKLYVFLNAWQLSAAERKRLLAETRGAVRVWCYTPGYFDSYRTSTEAMRALTGFALARVAPMEAWAQPTQAGKNLGLRQAFGTQRKVKPLFATIGANPAEVLAAYPDGSAAVAMRRTTDGTSFFVGVPRLTSELLRVAARAAGVHLFTETDCNVYANGPFLALHASQDGSAEINTGKAEPVRDALTQRVIGRGPRLTLPLKKGETRVFRY